MRIKGAKAITTQETSVAFSLPDKDLQNLKDLPWQNPLDEWEGLGIPLLVVRRGDSRHPVLFIEKANVRYAIKETTPHMAEREIRNLQIIQQRGIPTLTPCGTVHVKAPPIVVEIPGTGMRDYINSDKSYTVTYLAPRVVPHVLLYRLPLTRRVKQRMLDAVAMLMVNMHEHGIYWGDPSLANALLRVDQQVITAVMADAETAEIFPTQLSEGLCEQDLAQFGESLAWQAEDLRIAKGLPEDTMVLDDSDYQYFYGRYRVIRREHAIAAKQHTINLYEIYTPGGFVQTFNDIGASLVDSATSIASQILHTPIWYQRRIYDLLRVHIPRQYARRFYNLIISHRDILRKNEERDVSIEEAAQDWYTRYHIPTILLLRQRLTNHHNVMQSYFEILQQRWEMSLKAGYEVPLEQAIDNWARHNPQKRGKLLLPQQNGGDRDTQTGNEEHVPEKEGIESAVLEPLLSTGERPLVHLDRQQLAQKLPEIMHETQPEQKDQAQNQEEKKGPEPFTK